VRTFPLFLLTAAAVTGLLAVPGGGPQAASVTATAPVTPATVSAEALPTWQVDGVVWDTVTVGDTVYATGDFSTARPPGTAEGDPRSVTRENLLAFDLTTGVVTGFEHTLDRPGRRVVASPDGSRVYVGGDFTTVDGAAHNRVAAFDTATGDLIARFDPKADGRVSAIAVSGSTVYLGGAFHAVNGTKRIRLAAVSATTGALRTRFTASADDAVNALAVSGTRLIVGGRFQKIDGTAKVGIGAVSTTTGAARTWTSRPVPSRSGSHYSEVRDLIVADGVVYAAAAGEGHRWFDGRFAATASSGALVWLDNCYGATYSIFLTGSVLYSVGHAHDCSSLGAFPEVKPATYRRAIAETAYATRRDNTLGAVGSHYRKQPTPSLLTWFPTLNIGTRTGLNQGPWAVTGNRTHVALAGEFTKVNGVAQQGLTRFAIRAVAPSGRSPVASAGLTPTATSTTPGVVRIAWTRTWDQDDASLTYTIQRDGEKVGTKVGVARFWSLTGLSYLDTGLTPGSVHTYRVVVSDAAGNRVSGGTSAAVTVAS
jgi:hypothetical protein